MAVDVTPAVPDLTHGAGEVSIVLVRLARDDPIDSVHAGDAAVRVAIKFSTEVRHDLFCANGPRGLANGGGGVFPPSKGNQAEPEGGGDYPMKPLEDRALGRWC